MNTLTLPLPLGCQYVYLALQTVPQQEAMPPFACVALALVELMKVMSHCPALVSIYTQLCNINYQLIIPWQHSYKFTAKHLYAFAVLHYLTSMYYQAVSLLGEYSFTALLLTIDITN